MSLTLKRGDVEQDPETTGHELQRLTHSFLRPFGLAIRRAIPFDDDEVWQNEDAFTLEDFTEGQLFDGVLKSNRRDGSTRRDDTSYETVGLEAKAERIVFQTEHSARVVYNATSEDAAMGDYDSDRVEMTVGEILAEVLDTMRTELSGILGDGTEESGYDSDELDMLTVVPPKTVFNGCTIPECIKLLMRHHPQFGAYLDPAAHELRVVDLSDLQEKTITVGTDAVIAAHLDFSTEDCFTACKVEGAGELIDREVELDTAWDRQLEADWTLQKAYEEPDTYGRVWRRFACPDTNLAPYRAVGDSPRILVHIDNEWQELHIVLTDWADVDYEAGEIELPWLARQWNSQAQSWADASVSMRYTYRYGPITARWPAQGYTGTAYTNRGLQREKVIIDHDAMRITVEGKIDRIESTTLFRDFLIGLKPGELVGKEISFRTDPTRFTIVSNDKNLIEIDGEPTPPLAPGHAITIYVRDDAEQIYEGETISKMELRAREWLKAHKDEKYNGEVPLSGIDLSVKLGQKISFAGTNNSFYDTLGATLIEVVHNFEHDRTELVLTSERTLGGQKVWEERYRRIVAEQERLNMESELKLLRRAVVKRHPLLFDGDRDSRLASAPEAPLKSIGKYGDATLLLGHAKLEEDDNSYPSLLITPDEGHNSLELSANFGEADVIDDVSLNNAVKGSTNRVADAGHRHVLAFDTTLRASGGGHTLSHAYKDAFEPGEEVSGHLEITWDTIHGHLLSVTTQG